MDDDPEIRELLRDFLVADRFSVELAADASEARSALDRWPTDLVLLDVMLPGESGFDLCREIRQRGELPIIFLTARDADIDKVRGFGLGADDYVVKSATPAEVVARVRAVLRRARPEPDRGAAVLDFGHLRIDVRAHEARVGGRLVDLTAKEFALLRFLAEHPRQVLTRDQVFEHVWGGEYGDRHTVTVHIGRLREKIEEDAQVPRWIVTVWGVGYRFEGTRR